MKANDTNLKRMNTHKRTPNIIKQINEQLKTTETTETKKTNACN